MSPASLGIGGQGIAAHDMLTGLEANGWETSYVGDPQPTRLGRIAARRPLRRWPRLTRELERREVRRRVPRAGWDLSYAMPGFLPRRGSGPRVLHQATRHPLVVVNELYRAQTEGALGRGFISRSEARRLQFEIERADLVRCESADVARELVSYGIPKDRIVHAAPGVDLERYQPVEKADLLTVAFIGPLALWKGLDVVAGLVRVMPDAQFVFVGGPVDRWSRRIVEGLDIERASDVRAVLASAHALVLPSVADGFGYVVLEAMASGCVPVVSPMVGAAEIAREIDERLVIEREVFVETAARLLWEIGGLAGRAREVAERYDRQVMAPRAAAAILERIGVAAPQPA